MSRWIETGKDERGRFYLETLKDPDGCKWLMNEVCCNADNREMVADFPFEKIVPPNAARISSRKPKRTKTD